MRIYEPPRDLLLTIILATDDRKPMIWGIPA